MSLYVNACALTAAAVGADSFPLLKFNSGSEHIKTLSRVINFGAIYLLVEKIAELALQVFESVTRTRISSQPAQALLFAGTVALILAFPKIEELLKNLLGIKAK